MPLVTWCRRKHVLGDMFCFQLSGYDVINVCDRGCQKWAMIPRGVRAIDFKFFNINKQFHSMEIFRLHEMYILHNILS